MPSIQPVPSPVYLTADELPRPEEYVLAHYTTGRYRGNAWWEVVRL